MSLVAMVDYVMAHEASLEAEHQRQIGKGAPKWNKYQVRNAACWVRGGWGFA